MGFSKKSAADSGLDPQAKKWVVAGISIRAALKPVSTKPKPKPRETDEEPSNQEEEATTPKAREARIPDRLPCPAAPRKRRPRPSRCHAAGAREFFTPPDLETVFKLGQC